MTLVLQLVVDCCYRSNVIVCSLANDF